MKFYSALLFLFLLVACGKDGVSPPPVTEPTGPSDIQVSVVTADFAAGQPRLPFVLYSGPQRVADVQRVTLTAFDLTPETPDPGWAGEATGYNDYVVPYWVAYPDLPHPGYWGLAADVILADGRTIEAQFTIEVLETSQSPAIGERPPASQNRTLAIEPDIHQLTSGQNPKPGLYQMTVAEAMESGRPTVVTFATPAFCQTRFCAPVVTSVEEVYEEVGEQANFIHIEVYQTFDPLVVADEMAEWGLETEPWTFVLDREGKVAARLGGPISPQELLAALTPLLPQ